MIAAIVALTLVQQFADLAKASAGLITLPDGRHLAIAVFVKDSTADETTRERTIAAAARAAFGALMKTRLTP